MTTVKELIELLKEIHPDTQVFVYSVEDETFVPLDITDCLVTERGVYLEGSLHTRR